MNLIGIDFESYWSADYTLTDLGTEAYVRDARFETILVGIEDGPARYWLLPDRFEHFVKNEVDWANTAVVMHHAHFDGLILSHHYGVKPAMFIDTLSMARALRGAKAGNSLLILGPAYGLGNKGDDTKWSKGKHLADFTRNEIHQYGAYCVNDVRLTTELAALFMPQFPADELYLIDLTVKMFTDPIFVGDEAKLRAAAATERSRKKELLTQLGYACLNCGGTGQQPDMLTEAMPCKKCDGFGIDKKPFASSAKFAEILRANGVEPQMKPSPTPGKGPIFAFARTDSAMQALQEDEDEKIRALADARVSIKSTIVETRSERFANMAARGPLPVYLNYCGAHTLRWSGGDGTNFQNMSNHNENRPEMAVLKQSICAPPGYKVVAADSAQGEARLLAWTAKQDDLTQAFREGRDVYSEHASTVYGRPIDRKNNPADKIPGHVGKVCLAEGTQVITNTGTKPIERVTIKDMLWDGEEWVQHQGLIFQGLKPTLGHATLWATADHEILTEHGWEEWRLVITNPSLFQLALNSASLPFSDGGVVLPPEEAMSTRHFVGVPVVPRPMSPGTHSRVAGLLVAMPALRKRLLRNAGGVTQGLWRTLTTVHDFLAGCLRRLPDAITRKTLISNTTASGGLVFIQNGAPTEPLFCATSRLCLGGIFRNWKWIVKKSMATTSQVTSDSSLAQSTFKINGRSLSCSDESKNSKQRMRTYDLACAGPRNRFTVLTDQGPLIVHNCILSLGFGSGYFKAATEFLKGALGAKPIQFTQADMETLQVNPSKFLNSPKKIERVAAMPSRLELNDRLIHCIVTEALVQRYRQRYPRITGYGLPAGQGFWNEMDTVIGHMIRGEAVTFGAHGIITTGKEFLLMPNGMKLHYRGLERNDDGEASYFDGRSRTKIYGSLLCENLIQSLHRIIVGEQMLEISKVCKVALMTHDEVVCVVPEDAAELTLQYMNQVMAKTPAWATGLPLAAEGGIGSNYAECKS